MAYIELAVFIAVILISIKKNGSLGMMTMIGMVIYVFLLKIPPAAPPFKLAVLILSIFIASSSLEACGGLDYMGEIACRMIAKYPKMITIIAPICSYLLSFLTGSGYVVAAILPIIYKIARQSGIRPERPLTASVIAANQASYSSPISAPTLAIIDIFSKFGIYPKTIFSVLMPATFIASICAALSMYNKGENIKADEALARESIVKREFSWRTKMAVWGFLFAVVFIAMLGVFKDLRPHFAGESVDLTLLVIILMLALSGIIVLICGIKPGNIFSTQTFSIGGNMAFAIFGISWLSGTFFAANDALIKSTISSLVANNTWIFAAFVLILAPFIVSHTASILTFFPLGAALGIPAINLLALIPTIDTVFLFPSYPSIQIVLELDKTGSTSVGKYVINHSFVRPGIVAISVSLTLTHIFIHLFG